MVVHMFSLCLQVLLFFNVANAQIANCKRSFVGPSPPGFYYSLYQVDLNGTPLDMTGKNPAEIVNSIGYFTPAIFQGNTANLDFDIPVSVGENTTEEGNVYGNDITVTNFTMIASSWLQVPESGFYTFDISTDTAAALHIINNTEYYCCTVGMPANAPQFKITSSPSVPISNNPSGTVYLYGGFQYAMYVSYMHLNGSASFDMTMTDPSGITHTDLSGYVNEYNWLNFDEIVTCQYSVENITTSIQWLGSATTTFTTMTRILQDPVGSVVVNDIQVVGVPGTTSEPLPDIPLYQVIIPATYWTNTFGPVPSGTYTVRNFFTINPSLTGSIVLYPFTTSSSQPDISTSSVTLSVFSTDSTSAVSTSTPEDTMISTSSVESLTESTSISANTTESVLSAPNITESISTTTSFTSSVSIVPYLKNISSISMGISSSDSSIRIATSTVSLLSSSNVELSSVISESNLNSTIHSELSTSSNSEASNTVDDGNRSHFSILSVPVSSMVISSVSSESPVVAISSKATSVSSSYNPPGSEMSNRMVYSNSTGTTTSTSPSSSSSQSQAVISSRTTITSVMDFTTTEQLKHSNENSEVSTTRTGGLGIMDELFPTITITSIETEIITTVCPSISDESTDYVTSVFTTTVTYTTVTRNCLRCKYDGQFAIPSDLAPYFSSVYGSIVPNSPKSPGATTTLLQSIGAVPDSGPSHSNNGIPSINETPNDASLLRYSVILHTVVLLIVGLFMF